MESTDPASLPLPVLIIVSGPPCAGKPTLARRLAAHFRLPLMTKDTVKETLFDTLGCGDRAWSKRLSGASMELLYRFAEAQVAACRSCIIEGNFRRAWHRRPYWSRNSGIPSIPSRFSAG